MDWILLIWEFWVMLFLFILASAAWVIAVLLLFFVLFCIVVIPALVVLSLMCGIVVGAIWLVIEIASRVEQFIRKIR